MAEFLIPFFLGTVFSFLGSVPPGTVNMAVLHLGLEGRIRIALRFATAVAVVEYPHAWIAVEFQNWITSRPVVMSHFQLITGVVTTALGIILLSTTTSGAGLPQKFSDSGFRKGIILGILNPMVIPFWIAITAYLRSMEWLNISSPTSKHGYLFGASVGALMLFLVFILLSKKLSGIAKENIWLKRAPGLALLSLGFYSFIKYLLN